MCRSVEVDAAQSGGERRGASAIERDADAIIGALVRQLSRDERLLVCLRYADGLADDEIAALTRMAVDDVRRLMASILDRARSLVAGTA